MKYKQPLIPKRAEAIHVSFNFIYLMMAMAKIEHTIHTDVDYRNPKILERVKRIKADCTEVQKFLGCKAIDFDFAQDRALELHRTMFFFADKNTEELRAFNDKVESDITITNEELPFDTNAPTFTRNRIINN